MSFSGSRNWFVCRCYKRSMYRVLSRISSLGGKIQKVMVGVSSAEIGEYSISQLPIERKSFWTGCSVLEGPQVGQCFYGDWHKECVWNYDWAGRVYKSACNDIEQQTQFQGSLLLDRMLSESRSVMWSQLHDLEQTLKANFCTFSKCFTAKNG